VRSWAYFATNVRKKPEAESSVFLAPLILLALISVYADFTSVCLRRTRALVQSMGLVSGSFSPGWAGWSRHAGLRPPACPGALTERDMSGADLAAKPAAVCEASRQARPERPA
jgi:hypothetical protein